MPEWCCASDRQGADPVILFVPDFERQFQPRIYRADFNLTGMFRHRYRYWFILVLSLYTYLNTVLCSVYYYFKIDIEWYYAISTILLCTLLTWEGNRLVEPFIQKKLPPASSKIRFLIFFFIIGNIVALIAAFTPVYFVGTVIHHYSWDQNSNPLKLNLIYTCLVNLFFHLLNAIFFFSWSTGVNGVKRKN